ncbi:hypothetical protein WCLP8_470005 [uncultured Gammaproteobacteria bacterium]
MLDLLKSMLKGGGSDLFITAGFPPAATLDGRMTRLTDAPLTAVPAIRTPALAGALAGLSLGGMAVYFTLVQVTGAARLEQEDFYPQRIGGIDRGLIDAVHPWPTRWQSWRWDTVELLTRDLTGVGEALTPARRTTPFLPGPPTSAAKAV